MLRKSDEFINDLANLTKIIEDLSKKKVDHKDSDTSSKPTHVRWCVRSGVVNDDEIRDFLKKLFEDDDSVKPEVAKEEPGINQEQEESVEEDDFETFVGGLVVDAVEVEDDGERMYFCSVDDDAFYMPKAVFEKYFVKI